MERTLSTTIDLKHQMPESDINKYITDINELGIKIHPKIWQEDSNYLQLNGEGAYIKNSDNDLLAEFTANNMQIGQEKNGHSRIEITKYGLDVKIRIGGSDIELAHMGPGKSALEDGSISNKVPYYSIGLRENSANDYDLNSTYEKGDICTYNNEVYICNTEISIPEAWNSNHWRFAIGGYSNAEGYRTIASGNYSHSEGLYTTTLGSNSHAEGRASRSLGDNSHAEGQSSKSLGDNSHAEGYQSKAIGYSSHAEGSNTYAEGDYSHAEGLRTYATGEDSHAEGFRAKANGDHSHAQNLNTVAGYEAQTAIGKYNDNQSDTAFEIGNGSINSDSNALTVDWNGNIVTKDLELTRGTIPASSNYRKKITFTDSNDTELGYIRTPFLTDGREGIQLETTRTVNGSEIYNGIQMYINASGTPSVLLNHPAAWRTALGLDTITYTYNQFRYASGFSYYATTGTSAPKAVKFGKVVTLGGAIKSTAAQSSTGQKVMGYVPSDCKPAQDVMFLQQGSGVARYQLFIRASDGALIADRYGTTTDSAIPNGAWLNISATYISATATS